MVGEVQSVCCMVQPSPVTCYGIPVDGQQGAVQNSEAACKASGVAAKVTGVGKHCSRDLNRVTVSDCCATGTGRVQPQQPKPDEELDAEVLGRSRCDSVNCQTLRLLVPFEVPQQGSLLVAQDMLNQELLR